MSFSDDEPPPADSSAGPMLGNAERVRLVAYNNDKAPLEENRQQVLLELVDTSSARERSGLDLVAVLDVSSSMGWEVGNLPVNWKLDKLKTAMKFVISKLGPTDRLSIVSFSTTAEKLCPLQSMTGPSKERLKEIVENLKAQGSTNMKAGLETGLKVVAGRQHKRGRVASVILMSDGQQNEGADADATTVPIHDVAVYTFGFGADQDAKVLEAIAGNSHGGTFYDVKDGENLSEHFSALLAGLQSVVVQDVKLTVWEQQGHSQIVGMDAGSYLPPQDDNARSPVTISFGYLYSGEVRKVVVDLLLPAVHREYRATVLNAQCTYNTKERTFYSPRGRHLSCSIRRTRSASSGAMDPNVKAELIRRRHIIMLEEAIAMEDINSARGKLAEAEKALDNEQPKSRHPLIDMLKAELAKLLKLATWRDLLAALLASKRSHDRQRFASRGDLEVTLFKPRSMGEYVDQAKMFEEDPSKPPPPTVVGPPVVDRPWQTMRIWGGGSHERRSSSGWAWAMVLLCTALAIGVILAGVTVFAVYLLYRPRMPYLAVSDARLELLQYGQDGSIDSLQVSITVVAVNNNSKAGASFSNVDLALEFHGNDVALLQAAPFVVARESSLPLRYNVLSAGRQLDPAGMQSMDESLKAGVVPLDLIGKARTRWKVGVFVRLRFWTRISCRLRFFFPGNGTVMPTDRAKCRSRSP
ncbi:unnamed protein product [Urochloa humidicola]